MNNKPFFSIIMPTRNRANLLPFALQSVLQQNFDDFEIIVSDNFSTDETADTVKEIGDQRIRYFRTTELLPVDENFEFALAQARGKFVSFLPDDDGYTASRLETCYDILRESDSKLLVHNRASYYPQGDEEFGIPVNSLRLPWFSNQTISIDSKKVIREMYSRIPETYCMKCVTLPPPFFYGSFPNMINAFYDNSVINTLRNRVGSLVKTRIGDLYMGMLMLNEIDQYIYLDAPLSITRCHSEQITLKAMNDGAERQTGASEAETKFENVPFKEWTERNAYADVMVKAYKDDPTGLGKAVEINLVNYYLVCFEDLLLMKARGFDVSSKIEDFHRALDAENSDTKNAVLSKLNVETSEKVSVKEKLQKLVRKQAQSPWAISARLKLSNKPNFLFSRFITVKENDYTILDYSKLLDDKYINQAANFWLKKERIRKEWNLK